MKEPAIMSKKTAEVINKDLYDIVEIEDAPLNVRGVMTINIKKERMYKTILSIVESTPRYSAFPQTFPQDV
ncbi:MAG: hypothetical protein IJI56_02650 [Firmicutes bacterium]|nr:hypothetical protein [Bacillota bacterium]